MPYSLSMTKICGDFFEFLNIEHRKQNSFPLSSPGLVEVSVVPLIKELKCHDKKVLLLYDSKREYCGVLSRR